MEFARKMKRQKNGAEAGSESVVSSVEVLEGF
jgi:hypothetical protein